MKGTAHHSSISKKGLLVSGKKGKIMAAAIVISAACCLMAVTLYYIIIPSMPRTTASAYLKSIMSKDYDKAAMYFINIPQSPMVNKESINAALKDSFDLVSDIKILEAAPAGQPGLYDVKYRIESGSESILKTFSLLNTSSSLMGFKKEWKVIFPFKVQDIIVNGIDGSIVYVDGNKAGSIENGELQINGLIWGKHTFKVELPGMGESNNTIMEVNDMMHSFTFDLVPTEGFRKEMERLIHSFCAGWSQYCMSRNPESIKPYLMERLYNEYIGDTERFFCSRYEKCDYDIEFKDILIKDRDNIVFNVNETWNIKEVITNSDMVFELNKKAELEQIQHAYWGYHIIRQTGSWKIDSVDQLSFKTDIIEN